MSMSEERIVTEIALIKKDIRNLEKLIEKVDKLINEINELSKLIAIQHKTIEIHEKRISALFDVTKNVESNEYAYRMQNSDKLNVLKDHITDDKNEIRVIIEKAVSDLENTIQSNYLKNEKRLSSLENWKWWIMGIGITVITTVSFIFKMIT